MQEGLVESKSTVGEGGNNREERKRPADLLLVYSRNPFHEAIKDRAVYDGLDLANIAG